MKRFKIEYLVSFAALALICFLVGVFVGRNSVHISGGVILEMETSGVDNTSSDNADGEAKIETVEETSETEDTAEVSAVLPVSDEEETTEALDIQVEEESEGLVNINTATRAELETLPGIGEVISQRIVDYREENGPFETVEEIMLVSGIGEKKFEAIRSMITVR